MSIKVGINGFGRIGRMVFRAAVENFSDVEIVGINDLLDPEYLAYMLKYDSVHGKFNHDIKVEGNTMYVDGKAIRLTAEKDPAQVVIVKGLGSGAGALVVALLCGDALPAPPDVIAALVLGFVAYGLSIFFYVYAQRGLGAARTSAYYAVNPFIGAALSLLLFQTVPGPAFLVALALMALGAWLVTPR